MAINNNIGANMFTTAHSSALEARIGQSIPMNNLRPLNFELIIELILFDSGSIAGPNHPPI